MSEYQCTFCDQDPGPFDLVVDDYDEVACECGLRLPGVDPEDVGSGFHIVNLEADDPWGDDFPATEEDWSGKRGVR